MMRKTNSIIVLIGASGSGKTTLFNKALTDFSDVLSDIVSYTTRQPRDGEVVGVDYNFIDENTFNTLQFAENVEVYKGCNYGTTREQYDDIICKNKIPFVILDVVGAEQLKREFKDTEVHVYTLFLEADINVLIERLNERGCDDNIDDRIARFEKELETRDKWDYKINTNKNVNKTYPYFRTKIYDIIHDDMLRNEKDAFFYNFHNFGVRGEHKDFFDILFNVLSYVDRFQQYSVGTNGCVYFNNYEVVFTCNLDYNMFEEDLIYIQPYEFYEFFNRMFNSKQQ